MRWTRIAYYLSILLSSSIVYYKNVMADWEISNRGYKYTDSRSFKEKFISFLKNYSYLFFPLLNLYVSINEGLRNKEDYLMERLNKLLLSNRIEKVEDKTKTEEKVEIKKEEIKEEKKEEKKETKTEEKKLTIDDLSIEEQIEYYERLDNEYRLEHSKIPKTKENVKRRNELVRKVKEIESKLSSLYRQQEIKNLKEEREKITGFSRSK